MPRLADNVRALGFRFEDVKILLSSHAHIDHVQGHALVRGMTGAQVVVSAADAPVIASGGKASRSSTASTPGPLAPSTVSSPTGIG